ncbi:MAG: type II toxin-antitoxin system VapC family toxin [Kiritimatiellae bacterium]|nr:type II toxin-antitoxin system VapC family toxin [Kiritimatiellia bacterium]
MRVLLDTCAILWAIAMPEKLSEKTIRILEDEETEVFVSPISCAEIACLQERGRIELDRHWKSWFDYYIRLNGWSVIDITLPIIQDAFALPTPFHADPADRIITATARNRSMKLVTGDLKLIAYPFVETMQ